MSTPTLPLNSVPVTPSLYDLLTLWKKDVFLNLACHHIGTIQSFDASTQTATASINYTKTFYKFDATTRQNVPVQENYPPLTCPVICLGGGDSALTFPIAQGDECLVLFNDRDLNNWFSGASGGPVATGRLHSISDGLIIVGVRSLANVVQNYDTTRAVLRKGNAMVGVGDELIKIANELTTLKTVINGLIDLIAAATVAPGGGPLLNAAAISAYKTTVGTLLE